MPLPAESRRSLACTNVIENMNGTIRRSCRNVKRWLDAAIALRWTRTAVIEAAKGFRRLKVHKQLSALRDARDSLDHAREAVSPPQPSTSTVPFSTSVGTFPLPVPVE